MAKGNRPGMTYEEVIAAIEDLKGIVKSYQRGEPVDSGAPSYRDAVKLLMHYRRKLNRLRPRKRKPDDSEE